MTFVPPIPRPPSDPSRTTQRRFPPSTSTKLNLTVLREGRKPSSRVIVADGDCVRIGSHRSNDVVLDDPLVSRFHCRLVRTTSTWQISDAGSVNGTMVGSVVVRDGDITLPECILELGDSAVRIQESSSPARIPLSEGRSFGRLFGGSVPMRRLFAVLESVAASDATVLIEGESGTGKELVASEIVARGHRAHQPFVVVDCSAISPNLIEAELFGHTRGAFTGADRERGGAFESANGGTVFLDEIGEMPLEMQPKLLRVLESREVRRVGEARSRKIDVRVVAATNRRLDREVNHGRFREDLFFRLSVVTVRIPPLRERLDDLELLVEAIVFGLGAGGVRHLFTPSVLEEMARHDWPGNVRELRNYIERSMILKEVTSPDDAQGDDPNSSSPQQSVREVDISVPFRTAKESAVAGFEKAYLSALLEWADGNISRAARHAGMDRMNLHRLVQRYGLKSMLSVRD